MSSINEMYAALYQQLTDIRDRYDSAGGQLRRARSVDGEERTKRAEWLQEQLKRIEDYSWRIKQFQDRALKHMDSKNLLTIPPVVPRRLDFRRLTDWIRSINPEEPDDPYARRVYALTKSNQRFLDEKRCEYEAELADLRSGETDPEAEVERELTVLKRELVKECRAVLDSEAFSAFALELSVRHKSCRDSGESPALPAAGSAVVDSIVLGRYALPLPVFEELRPLAKLRLGDFYDESYSAILLPVEQLLAKEHVISVSCVPAREKRLFAGVQNYLMRLLCSTEPNSRKVWVLDGIHLNNSVLGPLKPLEDSFFLERVPRSGEQIVDALKTIVSSFADIDEALGIADSVAEFNASAAPQERISRTVLVLVGYPVAFSGEAAGYIRRILMNHEHYGVSVVLVDSRTAGREGNVLKSDLEDSVENLLQIRMLRRKDLIRSGEGSEYSFKWYEQPQTELPQELLEEVERLKERSDKKGSEYVKRVEELEHFDGYADRGNKTVNLPYGVDSKDEVHSMSFSDENFAAFLMGASGSGKSTLLHTLITGIILNHHPDDVELWLADFKMSEFAQYMDPMPPHIKYILLDESQELVFDLLDRLTAEMMRRQLYFMHNRTIKKVEEVPKTEYMPVIFVILDEFSIMSQVVADSPAYKLKLQNLLAKGRALGIKFIFASQDFTGGVGGLSKTAKDQIQMRIAMKNSFAEISETLQLSAGDKTDQVRGWMEALPPHYALMKYRDGDRNRVKRVNVMYFKGKGEEAYAPQRALIRKAQALKPVAKYTPEDIGCYVDKHPVVVDGNSYDPFDAEQVLRCQKVVHTNPDYNGDEVLAFAGTPRLMKSMKEIVITPESRQNLLLICDSGEKNCGASVMTSVMRSFELQSKKVRVWAYERNKMYRFVRDTAWSDFGIETDPGRICSEIYALRQKLQNGEELQEELIVLLGFESLCADFELLPARKGAARAETPSADMSAAMEGVRNGMMPEGAEDSPEQAAMRGQLAGLLTGFMTEEDEEDEAEGAEFIDVSSFDFSTLSGFGGLNLSALGLGGTAEEAKEPEKPTAVLAEEEAEPLAEKTVDQPYNAREDLKYLIQHGSRSGTHFLLYLNTYADLKQTGLNVELFRHRLSFRLSADDSSLVFGKNVASALPEHICMYTDTMDRFTFRPYLHPHLAWDGWGMDENGRRISPMEQL